MKKLIVSILMMMVLLSGCQIKSDNVDFKLLSYNIIETNEMEDTKTVIISDELISELGEQNILLNYTKLFVNPKTSIYGISTISTDEVIDVQLAGMGEGMFSDLNVLPLDSSKKNAIQPRLYKIYEKDTNNNIVVSYQTVYFTFNDSDINIPITSGMSSADYYNQDMINILHNEINIYQNQIIDYSNIFNININLNNLNFHSFSKQNIYNNFYVKFPITVNVNNEEVLSKNVVYDMTSKMGNTTMLLKDLSNNNIFDIVDIYCGQYSRRDAVEVNLDFKTKLNITTISNSDEDKQLVINCLKQNYSCYDVNGPISWDNLNIEILDYNDYGNGLAIKISNNSHYLLLLNSENDIIYSN